MRKVLRIFLKTATNRAVRDGLGQYVAVTPARDDEKSATFGTNLAGSIALVHQGGIMTSTELRSDIHSIDPIPDADRDSTGPQQMWIWAGANIAPVNWALGALGIILKLGLWETSAVIVLGNIIGCAIFAAFTVMGHKTGVNQMVLSRSDRKSVV